MCKIIGKIFIAPSCWWICLCRKCVLIYEDYEKLDLLELHRSLGSGAQMLFRRKWRNLDTLLFLIVCQYSLHRWLNWVFFCCGSGFWVKFSRIARFLKCLQLGSRTELTTKRLVFAFFVGLCLVFCRHVCMDKNLQDLLNCDSLSTTWIIYFITIGNSNNNWWASSMQSNLFPMFFRLQAFNCQSSDESTLWLLLKVLYSFFIVFFDCQESVHVLLRFPQKLFFEV